MNLLEECIMCYGTGEENEPSTTEAQICEYCKGRGYKLTPLGHELTEFLEKVYGIKPIKE